MRMTDSHCHFDFDVFSSQRAQHWQQAQEVGVHRLVIPGVAENQWLHLPELCEQYSGLYYGLGLHPWWLANATVHWQGRLRNALKKKSAHCVALGEIGLDQSRPVAAEQQEAALVAQLKLANEFALPVLLHSHKTHDRVLKWLRRYPVVGGAIHGFSGSLQEAEAFWALGVHLGVGGTITYSRANKTRQAIAAMPLESLVLETDAPDMPLSGFQGQDNHPAQLPRVLDALAQLRQQEADQLAPQLEQNVATLFGWC